MPTIYNESAIIYQGTFLKLKIFVAPLRTKVHPVPNSMNGFFFYAGVAQLDRAMVF
jgi:hypothetical protein